MPDRDGEMDRFGIKVLQFINDQVLDNSETVLEQIKNAIKRQQFRLTEGYLLPPLGRACPEHREGQEERPKICSFKMCCKD